MSVGVEALFTQALGLQAPWFVKKVELDTAHKRIDFQVASEAKRLDCPACSAKNQGIHDRVQRSWRHLNFFEFEAWLHAEVPRVNCGTCGKTTTVEVPWARPGSGFTLLFEALAVSLCADLPVSQVAALLCVRDKRLWRRIEHYVAQARAQDTMEGVTTIGVDETSVQRGHHYITVIHDLKAQRLLFATPGKDHATLQAFKEDLVAHQGDPAKIEHVCMDMSGAFKKGVADALPAADISYDRYHVVALANAAMDEVRREETREHPAAVTAALGDTDRAVLKGVMWGMRKNPGGWTRTQVDAMHWLQHSNLKSARAWRLKQALREVYARAVQQNDPAAAADLLRRWISWAARSRLAPFKRLAATLREHFAGVVRGMLDGRNNAYVEAMNGLLQQAKRAARGYRNVQTFIAIAYLRMSKLKHLPQSPFVPAQPYTPAVRVVHLCT
ncbi:MAG: ISL3 family transposase [Pseudomonadota bacterium]|nr:ISL3 family transposase [Pseudomonadota bacterium]